MDPDDPNSYLNHKLFQSIIARHIVSAPFTIVKLVNTSAIGEGENFFSKILKNNVTIELSDGTTQHLSFISKIIETVFIDEVRLNEMKIFQKEMEMYQKIVPAFEKIWKDIGVDVVFGPKLYYAEMEPHKILIFEDLTSSDYKMINRLEGLNEPQVLLVLAKLAKWHAASKIYINRCETLNPILVRGMFHPGFVGYINGYYKLLYNSLVESLLDWDDVDAEHLDIIKSWTDKIVPTLTKLTTFNRNEFNVLNHGDLWINNMMLVTNDSEVSTDVKFIDYQVGLYASPVIDILYFLTMSTHYELFISKYDEFISFYHQELVSALKQLNYDKIPTLKDLHVSLLKNSFYSAALLIEGVPTILVDQKTDNIDFNVYGLDSELGAETRRKLFAIPRTQEAVKGLIRFYGKRGMLEL